MSDYVISADVIYFTCTTPLSTSFMNLSRTAAFFKCLNETLIRVNMRTIIHNCITWADIPTVGGELDKLTLEQRQDLSASVPE